ncbi:COP9 signalosome complex subunit 3-like isoform X2 [Quercus suber]|uniref:COP9 signalosome complex subunit 3-like isoform X2 n=1 Tax=Quercus suber TaxID=58331 RepID=UPI0032DEF475
MVLGDDMHRTTAFSQSPRAPTQCVLSIYSSLLKLMVVTARPMSTLNFIAVEAYKKYLLVSLIHHGQFSSSLPKYTSSAAWRNLKSFCQPYIELANGYSTGEIAELEANIQTNKENFERVSFLPYIIHSVLCFG